RFESPLMFADWLVRLASGHVPVCSGTLVTSTVIVQLDALAVLAGTTRFVTVMVVPPAAAVTDPPVHVPPTFGFVAIWSLLGSVSVKLTVCAGLNAAGFVTVNVSVAVPPMVIADGLNALFRLGTSGVTVTQLGVTALVRFESPLMFADVSVRFASGHVPACSGTLVTSTVIV